MIMKSSTPITAALLALLLFTSQAQTSDSPASTLDALQTAGRAEDRNAILQLTTDDASILGFDNGSHWTGPTLTDELNSYFSRGGSWPQSASNRRIKLSPQGDTAWFNESIKSPYGNGVASGVLLKTDSGWQIVQYHIFQPTYSKVHKPTAISDTSNGIKPEDSTTPNSLSAATEGDIAGQGIKKRCRKIRHKTNRASSC